MEFLDAQIVRWIARIVPRLLAHIGHGLSRDFKSDNMSKDNYYLVQHTPRIIRHFVEFIYAADSSVTEHKCAALQNLSTQNEAISFS